MELKKSAEKTTINKKKPIKKKKVKIPGRLSFFFHGNGRSVTSWRRYFTLKKRSTVGLYARVANYDEAEVGRRSSLPIAASYSTQHRDTRSEASRVAVLRSHSITPHFPKMATCSFHGQLSLIDDWYQVVEIKHT